MLPAATYRISWCNFCKRFGARNDLPKLFFLPWYVYEFALLGYGSQQYISPNYFCMRYFYAQPYYMQNGFLGTQAMINVAVRACSKKYWKMFTVCHGSTSIASLLPPLLLFCCIWHCNVYKPFTNNLFGLFHSKLNIQKVHQIQYHFLNVL